MALTDLQYYSQFEGRVGVFVIGRPYAIGDIVTVSNRFFQLTNTAIGTAAATDNPVTGTNTNWVEFEAPELGNNRFLTLEEAIDNYMVLYADEAAYGGKAMRMKIEALAKRAVQEFNYDILRVRDLEYELLDLARVPMPQDFVELVAITYTDLSGVERWLNQRLDSSNPRSALQAVDITTTWMTATNYTQGDTVREGEMEYVATQTHTSNGNNRPGSLLGARFWRIIPAGSFIYNDEGEIIYAEGTSATKERYDESILRSGGTQTGFPVNISRLSTGSYYYGYGRRYYLDTEKANINGTYYIDEIGGAIDIDPALIGEIVTLRYVSDGLSNNPAEIRLHKFAEQALYDTIYYEYISRRADTPANEKERAKRRMKATKRNAKLRLGNFSKRELLQTLRAQEIWIKK